MKDIFERIKESTGGPLGQYRKLADGYFYFPKLEGELGPEMTFNGKKVLNWSLNNYLGLANNPEVRAADEEGARRWGLAYPMGARMMSGHTSLHEEVEAMLCEYTHKKHGYLLNFGYQGQISILDTIVSLRDVIVYDSEAHACLIDGFRVTGAKRFKYQHNDIESLRKQLTQATALAEKQGGGILVATEGVYGMEGDLGALDESSTSAFSSTMPMAWESWDPKAAVRTPISTARTKSISISVHLPRLWPSSAASSAATMRTSSPTCASTCARRYMPRVFPCPSYGVSNAVLRSSTSIQSTARSCGSSPHICRNRSRQRVSIPA